MAPPTALLFVLSITASSGEYSRRYAPAGVSSPTSITVSLERVFRDSRAAGALA